MALFGSQAKACSHRVFESCQKPVCRQVTAIRAASTSAEPPREQPPPGRPRGPQPHQAPHQRNVDARSAADRCSGRRGHAPPRAPARARGAASPDTKTSRRRGRAPIARQITAATLMANSSATRGGDLPGGPARLGKGIKNRQPHRDEQSATNRRHTRRPRSPAGRTTAEWNCSPAHCDEPWSRRSRPGPLPRAAAFPDHAPWKWRRLPRWGDHLLPEARCAGLRRASSEPAEGPKVEQQEQAPAASPKSTWLSDPRRTARPPPGSARAIEDVGRTRHVGREGEHEKQPAEHVAPFGDPGDRLDAQGMQGEQGRHQRARPSAAYVRSGSLSPPSRRSLVPQWAPLAGPSSATGPKTARPPKQRAARRWSNGVRPDAGHRVDSRACGKASRADTSRPPDRWSKPRRSPTTRSPPTRAALSRRTGHRRSSRIPGSSVRLNTSRTATTRKCAHRNRLPGVGPALGPGLGGRRRFDGRLRHDVFSRRPKGSREGLIVSSWHPLLTASTDRQPVRAEPPCDRSAQTAG